MYYPKVNRGLRFTKPGLYSLGFILAIGMIAIATGINGLYIFLSAGLGGFIVSGLLSERVMKICTVTRVGDRTVAAGEPFSLEFELTNANRNFAAHGVSTYFLSQRPRFRLLATKVEAEASHYVGTLDAAASQCFSVAHKPMKRGKYTLCMVMQQTTFPFGVLEKFKFLEIPAQIVVTPTIDKEFYREMLELARRLKLNLAADREFFSHRPYTSKDSSRTLDWKKSAGRPPEDWLAKVYRSAKDSGPIMIEVDWAECSRQLTEDAYERLLSRIYSASKALSDEGLPVALNFSPWGLIDTTNDIEAVLAGRPPFAQVKLAKEPGPTPLEFLRRELKRSAPTPKKAVHLHLTSESHQLAEAQ